jgi:hypothetical protein
MQGASRSVSSVFDIEAASRIEQQTMARRARP